MITTLESTLLSDLKKESNNRKSKVSLSKPLYDKKPQTSTIPVNEKNFRISVKDSVEDVERILNNDHIQVSCIKPLIYQQRELEITKEQTALLSIQRAHDTLKTSNKNLEYEYKKFMDYISSLEEIGEADVGVNATAKEASESILQQVDDVEDATNKARRAFFMYDHMRIRVRDDIVDIKSKLSAVMTDRAKKESEFLILQSTLRQIIHDVKLLEKQYNALEHEIISRRDQRHEQLESLQSMVSDGQQSVAKFQQTSMTLDISSNLHLKSLSEFVPTAPPIRMIASQRSFQASSRQPSQSGEYFSSSASLNAATSAAAMNNNNTTANDSSSYSKKLLLLNNSSQSVCSSPQSSPKHNNYNSGSPLYKSGGRKLRYTDDNSEDIVADAAIGDSAKNMKSPTSNNNNNNNNNSMSLNEANLKSRAMMSNSSNNSSYNVNNSTSKSRRASMKSNKSTKSLKTTIGHNGSAMNSTATFIMPTTFNAAVKLSELQILQDILHEKFTVQEQLNQQLLMKEKEIQIKIEETNTTHQWIQAQVDKTNQLHTLQHQLDSMTEKDISITNQMEFLQLAIPRFLLKVMNSQLTKQQQKAAHSLLNALSQNITVEQLPEMILKLEEELVKMIDYIAEKVTPPPQLTISSRSNGGGGGDGEGNDVDDNRDSPTHNNNSASANNPNELQRGMSKLFQQPAYSSLLRQQYMNLMTVTPSTNPRNVRVQSMMSNLVRSKENGGGSSSKGGISSNSNKGGGGNSSNKGFVRHNSNASSIGGGGNSDDDDDDDDSYGGGGDDNGSVASWKNNKRKSRRHKGRNNNNNDTDDDDEDNNNDNGRQQDSKSGGRLQTTNAGDEDQKPTRIIPVLSLNRNTLKDISRLIVNKYVKNNQRKQDTLAKKRLQKRKLQLAAAALSSKKKEEDDDDDYDVDKFKNVTL